MFVIINVLLLLLLIISILYWFNITYLTKKKIKKYCKKFPNPPQVPIFGNALDFKSSVDILKVFDKNIKLCGGIIYLKIGPTSDNVILTDYKFIEYIFNNNKLLSKSLQYKFFIPWLGKGLLTSNGNKWKKHRKLLTPAFHFKILHTFLTTFESSGQILIKKLKKECGNSSFDIFPYISLCTLDIICETAMGTTVNAQENENSEYIKSIDNLKRIIVDRFLLSAFKYFDAFFYFTADYNIWKKSLSVVHKYTENVIKRKQEKLKNKKNNDNTKNKKVFLDILLEAEDEYGEKLSFNEIREEVDTFMFEGHDTVATALSFALYSLANNPNAQQKAYEEQTKLFDNLKEDITTYNDLQNMKYLENVIKETLRMYPPVPFFSRVTTEDILDYNGEIIPKGINFTIYAYGMHRNPTYFPNPDVFNPSRFENMDKSMPFIYFPFSAGSRNCIGQKYAMLEMKSILSKVIRNFELLPANPKHELILASEIILKSVNGIRIGLRKRSF